jgi:hypothetical protein
MTTINNQVNNLDIAGLLERMDRARFEILKSSSANVDDIREADRARIDTYIAEAQSYADYIAAEPQQDYPESYPDVYEVDYKVTEDITKVENLGVRDIDRLFKVAIVEISNSQSARYPSGFKTQDKGRFDQYTQRIRDLLEKHLDKVNPLDLPESNPSESSITDGNIGIG